MWRGCGSNIAHPLDTNLWQIGVPDMATHRWIEDCGSDGGQEVSSCEQLQARDPRNIIIFINMAGGKNFGYMGLYDIYSMGMVIGSTIY